MVKLSKRFYIVSALIVAIAIPAIMTLITQYKVVTQYEDLAILLVLCLLLYLEVVLLILVYRMWAAIQDGHARTTPGKAVGFLFIPLFSWFWAVTVLWGFAQDYNKYLERHSIKASKLPEILFLVHSLLWFAFPFSLFIIPQPFRLAIPLNFILGFIIVAKICDAVNALAEYQTLRQQDRNDSSAQ
jgi:hypothetical protein